MHRTNFYSGAKAFDIQRNIRIGNAIIGLDNREDGEERGVSMFSVYINRVTRLRAILSVVYISNAKL
jgi:hypothetical protein